MKVLNPSIQNSFEAPDKDRHTGNGGQRWHLFASKNCRYFPLVIGKSHDNLMLQFKRGKFFEQA